MIIKELISRIVHKSDVEKRWQLAVDFVPLKGEIIIYDRDDNIEDEAFKGTYSYARFKIGDGVTKVNELPFANSSNFIGPDSPDGAPDGSFWVDTDEEGGFKITVNGIAPDENGNIEIEVTDPYVLPVGGEALGGVKNGGNVVIDAAGAMNVEVPSIDGLATEEYVDAAIEAIPKVEVNYPVTSVNGQTGAVNLDAEAVGALSKDTVIPTVPTNVSAFVNDAGYLTQHQSLAGLATEDYVDEVAGDLQDNIDALSSAVELLTNGVDAESVDGVNDLIVYVNEHGAEVTGMKADIKANADTLAELAPVAKTGSWNDLTDKPTELSAGLTINGPSSSSGLLNNMGYYKVSDVVPTLDDFARGCTFTDASGSTETYTASQITFSFWRGLNVIKPPSGAPGFFVLPQNGTFSGVTFTPGVYFNQRNNSIAHTLTAPGKEIFKKDLLDIVWNDVGDKPTSYPSDWNNITNKPNLFASTWDEIENKPIKDIADLVINKPSGSFVAAGFHGFKNVSGTIPSAEDLQNGFSVTFTNGNVTYYNADDIIIGDYFNSGIVNIYPSDLSFIIFSEDGLVDGLDAPAGVYFEEKYTKTLTINPRTILDPERVKVSWNGIDNAPVVDLTPYETKADAESKLAEAKSYTDEAVGAITFPEVNYPVTSVNGQTGAVVIDIPSTEGLATEEYVNSAITNINTYYTKAEIDNMEFITLDEIDAICARTIEVVSPTSGTF